MDVAQLADKLERLEAADQPSTALLELLRSISDPDVLWQVADRVVAYLAIMEAVYQRALELNASDETAKGYLAIGYLFAGAENDASRVIGSLHQSSRDPVLLSAWSALASNPSERTERLESAIMRVPDSLRLWRDLATTSLRYGPPSKARQAHLWLLDHENDPRQRQRVAEIVREQGWG